MGKEINAKERILACMPTCVAYLYNRLHGGGDGKVAYERIRGKKADSSGRGVLRKSIAQEEFGVKV
eukprot:1580203-Karenia_brevis.AAC.1